jgi:hypothetical protein
VLANAAYHSIAVALATGLLILAFAAITLRAFVLPGADSRLRRLSREAETVALWAATIGLGFFLIAIALGFLLRPLDAFLNSPISKNKIMTAFMAVGFWGSFLLIRMMCGEGLWRVPMLKSAYWLAALAGLASLLVVNSVGGDLGGIPSGFEHVAMRFGIETRATYYLPLAAVWLFFVVAVIALAWGVLGDRQAARSRERARTAEPEG